MPTYEYVCEKCARSFDFFQSMNDPRLTTCIYEGCDGAVRRKLGTGAGIIFKGSGFYETDYRSEKYKEAAKKESSAGSESGGSGKDGSGSSDAKPAEPKKPAAGTESKPSAPAKKPAASSPSGGDK